MGCAYALPLVIYKGVIEEPFQLGVVVREAMYFHSWIQVHCLVPTRDVDMSWRYRKLRFDTTSTYLFYTRNYNLLYLNEYGYLYMCALHITPLQSNRYIFNILARIGPCLYTLTGFHTEGGGRGGDLSPSWFCQGGDIPPIKLQNSVFLMGILVKSFKKVFRRQIPFFSKFVFSNCPPHKKISGGNPALGLSVRLLQALGRAGLHMKSSRNGDLACAPFRMFLI